MTRGWQLTRGDDGVDARLLDDVGDLGAGDVTVDVTWSGINYKDALAFTGNPGVMRIDPLVPGIDLVGRVSASDDERWSVGEIECSTPVPTRGEAHISVHPPGTLTYVRGRSGILFLGGRVFR